MCGRRDEVAAEPFKGHSALLLVQQIADEVVAVVTHHALAALNIHRMHHEALLYHVVKEITLLATQGLNLLYLVVPMLLRESLVCFKPLPLVLLKSVLLLLFALLPLVRVVGDHFLKVFVLPFYALCEFSSLFYHVAEHVVELFLGLHVIRIDFFIANAPVVTRLAQPVE